MSDTNIDIQLDPKRVLASLDDMNKEFKNLSEKIEQALGKDVPKSIGKAEDAAERGTNKMQGFFRNLANRVKEDLKTAFDVGALTSGLKFGQHVADGVKQVFEMERAFDRLNSRLQLTGKNLSDFKKELGKKVAATGQKLEDVLPGVEVAASRGGVKAPKELSEIAGNLGKVKATTGESTDTLAETVVEILKNQGQKVTAESFKHTLDALQGTRTSGAFKSADEAGKAMLELAKYGKQFKLSTRELGGIAAQASKGGPASLDILHKLFEQASGIGGGARLNATLGTNLFKVGKEGQATGLNAAALGKLNVKSPQIAEAITGLTGASGNDLKLFAEAFQGGTKELDQVVQGSNEVAKQFDIATDNLASSIDKFKEKTKEAGREIGSSFSNLGSDLLHGRFKNLVSDAKGIGKTGWENKGSLAASAGLGFAGALLTGGAAGRLLKKVPGGGLLGGLAGEKLAEAGGAQKVFVINAAEIGGHMSNPLDKLIEGRKNLPGTGGIVGGGGIEDKLKGTGVFGKIANVGQQAVGASSALQIGGAVAIGASIGVAIGEVLLEVFPKLGTIVGESIFDMLHPGGNKTALDDAEKKQNEKSAKSFNERHGTELTPEAFAKAVHDGTLKAYTTAQKGKPTNFTNPSAVSGRR